MGKRLLYAVPKYRTSSVHPVRDFCMSYLVDTLSVAPLVKGRSDVTVS